MDQCLRKYDIPDSFYVLFRDHYQEFLNDIKFDFVDDIIDKYFMVITPSENNAAYAPTFEIYYDVQQTTKKLKIARNEISITVEKNKRASAGLAGIQGIQLCRYDITMLLDFCEWYINDSSLKEIRNDINYIFDIHELDYYNLIKECDGKSLIESIRLFMGNHKSSKSYYAGDFIIFTLHPKSNVLYLGYVEEDEVDNYVITSYVDVGSLDYLTSVNILNTCEIDRKDSITTLFPLKDILSRSINLNINPSMIINIKCYLSALNEYRRSDHRCYLLEKSRKRIENREKINNLGKENEMDINKIDINNKYEVSREFYENFGKFLPEVIKKRKGLSFDPLSNKKYRVGSTFSNDEQVFYIYYESTKDKYVFVAIFEKKVTIQVGNPTGFALISQDVSFMCRYDLGVLLDLCFRNTKVYPFPLKEDIHQNLELHDLGIGFHKLLIGYDKNGLEYISKAVLKDFRSANKYYAWDFIVFSTNESTVYLGYIEEDQKDDDLIICSYIDVNNLGKVDMLVKFKTKVLNLKYIKHSLLPLKDIYSRDINLDVYAYKNRERDIESFLHNLMSYLLSSVHKLHLKTARKDLVEAREYKGKYQRYLVGFCRQFPTLYPSNTTIGDITTELDDLKRLGDKVIGYATQFKERPYEKLPKIKKLQRNGLYTTAIWEDGSHTVVKRSESDKDDFDTLVMFLTMKKLFLDNNSEMKRWVKEFKDVEVDLKEKKKDKKSTKKSKKK